MYAEFKSFLLKSNALALAIGVIIGAALGGVVNSLVNDIIMPPIGLVLGNADFKDLFLPLSDESYATLAAAKEAGAPVIAYGTFLNTVINFLIVSFTIFLLVKQVNRMKQPAPAAAPTTKDCPFCSSPIPLKATRCPHCTSELKAA